MASLDASALRQSFAFLRQAPAPVLDLLAEQGRLREVPADSRLYWEGDACSHIAFVLAGEIRVFKTGPSGREITLYEIGPGETCILNASCLLSDKSYPADAVTLTGVRLFLLSAQVFRDLIDTSPLFRSFVFALLSERLLTVFQLIEEVVFGHLDQRLLEYLEEKSENGVLQATHQVIANDLGTSREVISRLLKDLERRGRLTLQRSRIVLREDGPG